MNNSVLRWDPCVIQGPDEFRDFLRQYIVLQERNCLLIGGAGFDSRAIVFPSKFSAVKDSLIRGIFFREERSAKETELGVLADQHEAKISKLVKNSTFPKISIFSQGGVHSERATVVGGRNIVREVAEIDFEKYQDVFVDISALSTGVFFPLIAFLEDLSSEVDFNLHLLVAEQPEFDYKINRIPADSASLIHGFKGSRSLEASKEEARLWIPILSPGSERSLSKVFELIKPSGGAIDVCPIIPFPSCQHRMPDQLIERFRDQLRMWRVDFRNFLYAAESEPLDSYRAISNLVSSRNALFENLGGSLIVLSPFSNKMLTVGALLAAIDNNLPVAMVETVSYAIENDEDEEEPSFVERHVWLCGEAYSHAAK